MKRKSANVNFFFFKELAINGKLLLPMPLEIDIITIYQYLF